MQFVCKVCHTTTPGEHAMECDPCRDNCEEYSLCVDCRWDRSCARCGTEVAFMVNGGNDMQVCLQCDEKLTIEYGEKKACVTSN